MMWKYLPFFFASLFAAQIEVGNVFLEVEIADTHETRRRGLSGRSDLQEGTGMLFVFDRSQKLSFWMKDTKIPLSIGFFNADQILLQVEDMDPPLPGMKTLPTYVAKQPALYALEVPQGWFEQHRIKLGTKFSFVDPLAEE